MKDIRSIVLLILFGIIGWGCSNSLSLRENEEITFINNTKNPLVLSVFEAQTASQMDLVFSSTKVSPDTLNVLRVDEDTVISKKNIYSFDKYQPVENIRVFIGIIRNDSLYYKEPHTISKDRLKEYKYRLKIQEDAEGKLVIDK